MSCFATVKRHFSIYTPGIAIASILILGIWLINVFISLGDNVNITILTDSFPESGPAGGSMANNVQLLQQSNQQSTFTLSVDDEGYAKTGKDVLLVNAWIGSGMPTYFPQFLETVKRHPSLSFLLVSTYDTPEFCPPDRSESMFFPSSNPNVKVHCSTTAELVHQSSLALCEEWRCSQRQLDAVEQQFGEYISADGQAWNNLKPLYATIFRRQFYHMFPHRSFSHWVRVDLDVFLGDWTSLFPALLLQYDVFTFFPGQSMNWQYIYLKGYISGFRMSHKIDTLWRSISIFRTPAAFVRTFHAGTFKDQSSSIAADEGMQTVNTLALHPEVSFIAEPDLLAVDFDVGSHRNRKIVFYGNKPDILEVSLYTNSQRMERFRKHSHRDHLHNDHPAVSHLGEIKLTHNCDMSWLQTRDRLCVTSTSGSRQRHQLDSGAPIRVTREPGSSIINAYKLPEPDHEQDRQVLAYHFQSTKNRGILYRMLAPWERAEVGKDWDSYWYMKVYDKMGRMSTQKSTDICPGDWE